MRLVGYLPNETEARRFAAFLITQEISALAEEDTDQWAIWVRDENEIARAKDEFEQFKVNPQDKRYRGAEQEAATLHREEEKRHAAMRKNVVEMRGKWKSSSSGRRRPVVITLIILSIGVSVFGNFGEQRRDGSRSTVYDRLAFCGTQNYM